MGGPTESAKEEHDVIGAWSRANMQLYMYDALRLRALTKPKRVHSFFYFFMKRKKGDSIVINSSFLDYTYTK